MVMTTFGVFPRDEYDFSSAEVGTALAALFARDENGLPKPGVIGQPKITAVTSAWKIRVSPFTYVSVDGTAIGLSGVSEAEELDIAPATSTPIPSGQSRIDVVCWDLDEALVQVVQGVPAATPTAPPVGGWVPLAEVTVKNGDSMVVAGQIKLVYTGAAAASGRQSGVVNHVAGGPVLTGTIYRSTSNFTVTFPVPFDEVPKLSALEVASGAPVAQWVQVYGLTKEKFNWRILSAGAAPATGAMHWEAEPR
jgi:hypothetical protein